MAKTVAIEYIECKTYIRGFGNSWYTSGNDFGRINITNDYDMGTGEYTKTIYTPCIHFKTPTFDGKSKAISITVPLRVSSVPFRMYVSLATSAFDTSYTYESTSTPHYSNLSTTLAGTQYECSTVSSSARYETITIDCASLESNTDYYVYFSPMGGVAMLQDVDSQTAGIVTYAPPFGAIQLFQSGSSAAPYLPHIFVDGEWKQCSPYVYSNGAWQECER